MTRLFTKDHEWIDVDGQAGGSHTGTVGITDYAQSQLGDITFVEVPEAGKTLKKGDCAVVVDSVKAAADAEAITIWPRSCRRRPQQPPPQKQMLLSATGPLGGLARIPAPGPATRIIRVVSRQTRSHIDSDWLLPRRLPGPRLGG